MSTSEIASFCKFLWGDTEGLVYFPTRDTKRLAQFTMHGYLFGGYKDNDEPSEEERARWRRRRENENAFWRAQEKKHADNPIMQLHCRNKTTHDGTCEGCDFNGFDGERPDWPCRTVRLVCTGDPDFVFKDDNVIDS